MSAIDDHARVTLADNTRPEATAKNDLGQVKDSDGVRDIPNVSFFAAQQYGTASNASCNSSKGNGVASSCVFHDVTLGDMDLESRTRKS